jgi:hypothetical protein
VIVCQYTVDTFCQEFAGFPAVRKLSGTGSQKSHQRGRDEFSLSALLSVPFQRERCHAGTSYSHLWGGFSTSLVNRSPEQCGNAGRAALDLNGSIVSPGAVFSFNDTVGARDTMKGYRPAPIINDRGGLDDIPGGGICQLATTITTPRSRPAWRLLNAIPIRGAWAMCLRDGMPPLLPGARI